MISSGFTYSILLNDPQPPEIEFPFGIDNMAWAEQNGFGRDIAFQVTANDRYVSILSPTKKNRYYMALNGPGPTGPGVSVKLPTGQVLGHSKLGCIAYADRELYGDYSKWFIVNSQFLDLRNLVIAEVLNNKEFISKVKRWSMCMSKSNLTYASPMQAMRTFNTISPPRSPKLADNVAEHEVACGFHVQLFQVANHLARIIGANVNRRYASVVSTNSRFDNEAFNRARKILGVK